MFTTSPEGVDGNRERQLALTGDFTTRWAIATPSTRDDDRLGANVHAISNQPVAYRGIGVSVGVVTLGDRRINFTNVGVFLQYA